jgi:Tfp pilus assembly protein PilW
MNGSVLTAIIWYGMILIFGAVALFLETRKKNAQRKVTVRTNEAGRRCA